jgi:hypothetical protein
MIFFKLYYEDEQDKEESLKGQAEGATVSHVDSRLCEEIIGNFDKLPPHIQRLLPKEWLDFKK